MHTNFKALPFIVFSFCFLPLSEAVAQFYDSSILVATATHLYENLPSFTMFSKKDDVYAKNLKLKRITQKCYLYDSLITNKSTEYNRDGTIRKMTTTYSQSSKSIVLTMRKNKRNFFKYAYSLPTGLIDSDYYGNFEGLIDSFGLHEKGASLKVRMHLKDSITAENVTISLNNKYFEKRKKLILYSFLANLKDTLGFLPERKWDTTFENGLVVKTIIDSSNKDKYQMFKNFHLPVVHKILKYEFYSKAENEEWLLYGKDDFFYNDSGWLIKTISKRFFQKDSLTIDSLDYYPNGHIRSRKIYTPNGSNCLYFRDSVFSVEGKLLYKHSSGCEYSETAKKAVIEFADDFYTYNKVGCILQLRRYFRGKMIYLDDYGYEFWKD